MEYYHLAVHNLTLTSSFWEFLSSCRTKVDLQELKLWPGKVAGGGLAWGRTASVCLCCEGRTELAQGVLLV